MVEPLRRAARSPGLILLLLVTQAAVTITLLALALGDLAEQAEKQKNAAGAASRRNRVIIRTVQTTARENFRFIRCALLIRPVERTRPRIRQCRILADIDGDGRVGTSRADAEAGEGNGNDVGNDPGNGPDPDPSPSRSPQPSPSPSQSPLVCVKVADKEICVEAYGMLFLVKVG